LISLNTYAALTNAEKYNSHYVKLNLSFGAEKYYKQGCPQGNCGQLGPGSVDKLWIVLGRGKTGGEKKKKEGRMVPSRPTSTPETSQ
jgi:hypothetical protein